jgi:hypothetical protein
MGSRREGRAPHSSWPRSSLKEQERSAKRDQVWRSSCLLFFDGDVAGDAGRDKSQSKRRGKGKQDSLRRVAAVSESTLISIATEQRVFEVHSLLFLVVVVDFFVAAKEEGHAQLKFSSRGPPEKAAEILTGCSLLGGSSS